MKIENKKTFTVQERDEVSSLVLSSLHEKLLPIVGAKSKALTFLNMSYFPTNCFFIKENQSIVAFLAFKTNKGGFIRPSLRDFYSLFGVSGIAKAFAFAMMEHKVNTREMYIEAIAVDSAYRGRGIGTNLIEHFFDYARNHSCKIVSLEVVDSNPKALSLYKKLGFVIKNINSMRLLKMFYPFKFDSTFFMEKAL